MARIRTIKPEAFYSESLSQVSLEAERTFFGLLTQSDDYGYFRDQPAMLNGQLWPMRPEHGPRHMQEDLNDLVNVGILCRYEDTEGRTVLHMPNWDKHQRVPKPTASKFSECPLHDRKGNLRPVPEAVAGSEGASVTPLRAPSAG